jgi:hypothetical protein
MNSPGDPTFLAWSIAFFAVAILYAYACEKIR